MSAPENASRASTLERPFAAFAAWVRRRWPDGDGRVIALGLLGVLMQWARSRVIRRESHGGST